MPARAAAAAFAAQLIGLAFAPLARSLGFFGETVVEAVALDVARAEHGGLTDALERAIALTGAGRP